MFLRSAQAPWRAMRARRVSVLGVVLTSSLVWGCTDASVEPSAVSPEIVPGVQVFVGREADSVTNAIALQWAARGDIGYRDLLASTRAYAARSSASRSGTGLSSPSYDEGPTPETSGPALIYPDGTLTTALLNGTAGVVGGTTKFRGSVLTHEHKWQLTDFDGNAVGLPGGPVKRELYGEFDNAWTGDRTGKTSITLSGLRSCGLKLEANTTHTAEWGLVAIGAPFAPSIRWGAVTHHSTGRGQHSNPCVCSGGGTLPPGEGGNDESHGLVGGPSLDCDGTGGSDGGGDGSGTYVVVYVCYGYHYYDENGNYLYSEITHCDVYTT